MTTPSLSLMNAVGLSPQSVSSSSSTTPASPAPVTSDQLLYQAFNTLSAPTTVAQQPLFTNQGLLPQDAQFANTLGSLPVLQATSIIGSVATLENIIPGFGATQAVAQPTQSQVAPAPTDTFSNYKSHFLGTITPQNALDLVSQLAGPYLSQ